jgi:preprotein translocase subunit SecA
MSDLSERVDDELRARSAALRQLRSTGQYTADQLSEALNVSCEAIRRTTGLAPADEEVEAARAMCLGLVAQLPAGGGQGWAVTLAAYWYSLARVGVHVMTFTDALAEWHSSAMRAPLRLLGCDVGLVAGASTDEQRRAAYAADVTCGSHLQFAADHLRGDLHDDVADATQRGTHVLIVDDVDLLLVEHANLRSMVTEPRPPARNRDVERAASELREGGHYLIRAGRLHLTRAGVAVLKRAVGWAARPDIASVGRACGVESIIRNREGLTQSPDRMVRASVTVREHVRRYHTVCGLTSVAPRAEELESGYNLRLRPITPAKRPTLREHPGLVYATDADRLAELTRRVETEHQVGRPVLVAAPSASTAAEIALAFEQARIAHDCASAGDEVTVLNSAARPGAVTVIDLDTCQPPQIRFDAERADLANSAQRDERAGQGGLAVLTVALGSSRRQMDRLRALVGSVPSEIWLMFSMQDSALAAVDSRFGRWVRRHDPTPVVLDGHTLVARLLSRQLDRVQAAADAAATKQRMEGWSYASTMDGHRDELLQARRVVTASSDTARLVQRMIDETVTDWIATAPAQELADRVAGLTPARFLDGSGPVADAEQARDTIRRAYQQREDELGPDIMRLLERNVLVTVIDRCWREHSEALTFLAQHADELYGEETALTSYRIDADHLGHELRRRVRRDSLRHLFELIVVQPP